MPDPAATSPARWLGASSPRSRPAKPATVSRDPERPEREAVDRHRSAGHALGPALVEPDDRRAQRRAGVVGDDDVPRWVVSATPAMHPAGDRRRRQQRAGHASPIAAPVQLGVLLGPAGPRRDVRLDRDPGAGQRARRAGRTTSARTLWVPTSRARIVVGGRSRSRPVRRSSTPGVMMPVRVELRARRPRAPPCPSGSLLGGQVRRVVAPDAVLVADGAAVGDDRLAGRAPSGAASGPASRPGRRRGGRRRSRRGSSRSGRRWERWLKAWTRSPRVVEPVAERPPDGGGEVRQAAPGDRGLEGVERVARLPQRVAQVRRPEPRPLQAGREPRRPIPPWPPDDAPTSRNGRLGRGARCRRSRRAEARLRPDAGAQPR